MNDAEDCTDRLVDFLVDTKFEDIPKSVVETAKRVGLDTLACTVAGYDTEIGRGPAELKIEQGGKPESTLFVTGHRLPCSSVAYAHAPMANAHDADETILHMAHFANLTFLPAIAVAERVGASGKDVLAAFCVGFDLAARVGLSMPTYGDKDMAVLLNGFGWAVFGTAAAAGRLLGLSREQMHHALGIAFDSAPVRVPAKDFSRLSMMKYTPYGVIADVGVNAALLAARGHTGHDTVFKKSYEFWRAFGSPSCRWNRITGDLGKRWFVAETSLKPYPVGRPITHAVGLFLDLMKTERLERGEIDKVVVRMAPTGMNRAAAKGGAVRSAISAPFSVSFGIAMAASGIPPGPQWHLPQNLFDPAVEQFAQRVEREMVEEWYPVIMEQLQAEGYFNRLPTEVVIHARGRTFRKACHYAKGDPWSAESVLTDTELKTKALEYAGPVLGRDKVERAWSEALRLDAAPDVSALVRQLYR